MTLNEQISYWADCVRKKYGLFCESRTPDDDYSINSSFNKDVSDEKFSPTKEFLQNAYNIIKERLYDNKTIPDADKLVFEVISAPRKAFVGNSKARINSNTDTVIPIGIQLNGSVTLSLHEWLEVIVHETVHMCDYVTHPEHFLGFQKKFYDAHGKWFLDYGKQFEKYGFNVQKYLKSDIIGVNTDDKRVSGIIKNSVFVVLRGMKTSSGSEPIFRINRKNIEKYVEFIQDGANRGRYKGLERIVFYKSDNPKIIKIPELRMRDSRSTIKFFGFGEDFNQKFGPFEEIQEVMINSARYNLAEDRDEDDYDNMNHIDDEYARKMYDNIKGVIDVKKVDDGIYDFRIF